MQELPLLPWWQYSPYCRWVVASAFPVSLGRGWIRLLTVRFKKICNPGDRPRSLASYRMSTRALPGKTHCELEEIFCVKAGKMTTHSHWYSHVRLVYNKRVLPRIDNGVREDMSKRKCCKCWRAACVPIRFVTKLVSLSCDAFYSPRDENDIDTDSFPRPWLGKAIRVTSTTFWEKQTLVNADRRRRWLLNSNKLAILKY